MPKEGVVKTKEEREEYSRLWSLCNGVLLYPEQYKYNAQEDTYQCTVYAHRDEWFYGRDVRRLKELEKK